MTTPMLMTEHPTEELLAEYIDDRLDAPTREPVTDHLATCGECREIMLMSMAFQESERKVVHGGRRWMAAIGGLAAAAVIAVIVTPRLFGPSVDDLVAASEGMSRRVSDGRFAGGFAHTAEPSTMRGGDKESADFGAKAELLKIRIELEKTKRDPHALGLVRLLTAEDGGRDVRDAVDALEIAYRHARGEERDAVAVDLAAALIAYSRWSGHDKSDNTRALELSNDVLKRQPKLPEALWNRAVALASLNRDDEALRAFDDYLNVDSTSKWAEEATIRKGRIESFR